MASMMAGTMRTPFTAIFFAVELTHDFQCMPHLLVGAITALFVTVLLMRRSILTEKIARRGHHVSREYSFYLFQLLRVKEVMAKESPSAPASMTVAELADLIAEDVAPYAQRHGLPLVLAAALVASVRCDRLSIADSQNELLRVSKSADRNKLLHRKRIFESVTLWRNRL
jgi:hypothetical protein